MIIFELWRWVDLSLQRVFHVAVRRAFPGAAKLCMHRSARLVGRDRITIGNNFTALVGLRLEAVTEYAGSTYMPRIVIKDDVTLNDYVHIGATNYVEIGNNVLVASKVFISDHIHGNYGGSTASSPLQAPALRALTRDKSVVIEDNVWLCEGVSVLPGVRIGYGSIIAAHSVVTKDIPPMCIAAGIPAKVVKMYNETRKDWDRVDG
jgi:acetyltransferase-like isoleucine patch superfamily enzyme